MRGSWITIWSVVLIVVGLNSAAVSGAAEFNFEKAPVTLTGKQGTVGVLKTTAGSSECTTANFAGTASATSVSSITVAPTFGGCTCIGVTCTVDVNECTYLLSISAETTGTVDVVCPAGKEITLTNSKCTIHIPAQTGIGTVTYKDIGSGSTREIELGLNLTGIHYAHTEGTGIGKCTTGTSTSGTLTGGTATMTGEEDSGGGHVGVSTAPIPPPKFTFNFEKAPVTLTGKQGTVGVLKTTAGSSECTTANFAGTASATSVSSITVAPTFGGCTCIGVTCTVDVNECTYLLSISAETTGTVDVVCPAGKEITLTNSKCTIHIPAQTGIGTVTYKDIGSGSTREIELGLNLTGIHYAHTEGTGIGKCTTGTSTSGTLTGGTATMTGEEDSGGGHVGVSTAPIPPPKFTFNFEKAPVTLTGKQGTVGVLKTTAGSSECTTANFAGTASATSVSSITVAPTFGGCTCIGVTCTVDVNECTYLLSISAETTGTVDVVCPAGKEITLTNSKCTIHIPAQTGIGTVTYKDIGSGSTREIELGLNLTGIHYAHTEGTGIGKCTTGTSTSGTLTGGTATMTGEEDSGGGGHLGVWAE